MNNYLLKDIRTAAIVTGAYVAGTVLTGLHIYNQVNLLVDITKGSLTTVEVLVEFSPDNTNWYSETYSSITTTVSTESLGAHQFGADGKYILNIPLGYEYMRVSVKGTGTVTNSSVGVKAILAQID